MVLITGATGFLGSHLLIHLLEKGENVRAIYRNASKLGTVKSLFIFYQKEYLFAQIQWFEADIMDIPLMELAFKDITSVYHCAASISFDPDDEEQLRKINIEGTANIVNLALVNSISKLCFVSSIAALGDLQEHENTITEKTEWNAEKYHSDYAISKYGAEMEIWRGQQEGLNVVIVNPGVILGPNYQDEGSSRIFHKVKKGLNYYTKGNTGFIYVQDVAAIMYLLMKSETKGERFILIAENVSFEKILKTIATGLNLKAPHYPIKKGLTEIAWRVDWLLSNVFFIKRKLPKAMARSLHGTDLYSNQKIIDNCGFEFTDIQETIRKTVPFYTQE